MATFAWVRGMHGKLMPQVIRLLPSGRNDLRLKIEKEWTITDDEADELDLNALVARYPFQVIMEDG